MRYLLTTSITVLLSVCTLGQFRYSINKVNIKDTLIASKILGETRKIDIYTPEIFPEYADITPPVIYLLDGEAYINYFANTVNMLCQRFVQMPPITIVGVENYVNGSYNARDRDFDSTSDKFMQFVSEEVFPLVEKDYKKRPYRTIVGHSASASFAIEVFLKRPSLFNGYIASSPYLISEKRIRLEDSSFNFFK